MPYVYMLCIGRCYALADVIAMYLNETKMVLNG